MDSRLSSFQSYEYYASEYIDLVPGFHNSPYHFPSLPHQTILALDPSLVVPPEAGLIGGPNAADTGMVGAIGGTVEVGLMGAAVYSIPLDLPQGIHGMQPHLSITYNSQAGNGMMGWGWDLTGLSRVERTAKTRYHDGDVGCVRLIDTDDRFSLDGMRLVPVSSYSDSVEYKKEQDDMSKIVAYFSTVEVGGGLIGYGTVTVLDHFKIWTPDGLSIEYGTSQDSRIMPQEEGLQALFWLVKKVSDRNGNSVEYHYWKNQSSGEYYIQSIDYTEHVEGGEIMVTPEFTVSFHYKSANRQDYDFGYVAGNIVQKRKLLDHITVKRNSNNAELERYSFKYKMESINHYYGEAKMHNRLEEIGFEKGGARLNPTKITWTDNPDGIVLLSERIYDTAIYHNFPFVGDFNGDGYSDLAVVPHMDSIYTHNVGVSFFLNDSAAPGHFVQDTALMLHNVDRRLDWLYAVDLNDDGLDDLVACFYDSIAATGEEKMDVVILENNGGILFVPMDTVTINDGLYLIRTGDFLGNGKVQLLIVPFFSFLTSAFPILVHHNGNGYQKAYSNTLLLGVRDIATGDFDGDGRADLLVVNENNSTAYSFGLSGASLDYYSLFGTDEVNHDGRWNHVFPGDFNGDGKTDLLYNDRNNNQNRWRIFYSTGVSFTATAQIRAITCELPEHNIYPNSLRKVHEAINQPPYTGSGAFYGVCTEDFDGDGVDDIGITRMSSNGSSIIIHLHYLPIANSFQAVYNSGNNVNCKSQYFHTGNFLGKENVNFLGLEYRNAKSSTGNSTPSVFSLKHASGMNSVESIADGMGNTMEFTYGYVHDTYEVYGYGVRRVPVPIRVLATTTTYNASDRAMTERLAFSDPCYHRDGHGWLGFRKRESKTFEDGEEKCRTLNFHSLETMTSHAMLLPEYDTTYVFPEGVAVLSSATSYQFDKVLSTFGTLNTYHLVVCPALTRKTVTRYDPDSSGDILSKTFTENRYNYSNGQYSRTYHCDATLTGVGDVSTSGVTGCEFRTLDSTVYYYNDYSTWTIERPHKQIKVLSRSGKPDVEKARWYEYTSASSYLPSRVFDIPNREPNQDPLTLRTDLEYYADGNLMAKTISASHGQLGEQSKTVAYEYGPDGQHRLVSRETVSSGNLSYATTYSYDDYDRVDTLTAANGLSAVYKSDALDATSWTLNADGTMTCTVRRWSQGHPLAPAEALYHSWTRSSDGKRSMTFYHKTGAELRTVVFGLHGEPIFTDRNYDDRGRLSAVSDPYKEGETPRWTEYGYDGLDRMTSVNTPDTTCTATAYNGLLTETTVAPLVGDPQTNSVTVNVMGWTVRSDDASGSYVIYDHYADGLMASATVNGNPATTVTATYDHARRMDTLVDPDYGVMVTVYDAYGRLKRTVTPRESAALTQTSCVYDGLGRVTSVTDGMEGTVTQYSYNETGVAKGTLDEIRFQKQGGADIQKIAYGYDALARHVSAVEQRDGAVRKTQVKYDNQSRVSQIVYPSGVTVKYGYHRGYLMDVTDGDGHLLWRTVDMDAQGRLLEAKLGNGAVTRHSYDTLTHRLEHIVTTKNLQNLSFVYDNFGNLASRKDHNFNMEETFTYDDMNRLTGITLIRASGQDLHCAVSYDAMGRMTSRQAVTEVNGVPQVTTVFTQPVFDATKVHALASAQTTPELFPEDTQNIIFTGFDKVGKVRQGTDSLCYTYGYDRQRIAMEEHVGSLARTKQYWGACEYVTESDGNSNVACWRTYIAGPFGVFAVTEDRSGLESVHYVLKDNLGSWTAITDSDGYVEQWLSFDAWGNLRDPRTWANYTASDTFEKPMFDRGFTGHEHLPDFGLINMNGRMYDPVMSSFLSADRFVQNPMSAQGFNRFTYCMNNPLRFIDPTGWEHGNGPGEGGFSYGEHTIGTIYYVNGVPTIDLAEVIITPQDNPSLSNTYEKPQYQSYHYTGGSDAPWSDLYNGPSIGYGRGSGGGGNGGNNGGVVNNTRQNLNDNIEIGSKALLTANVYTTHMARIYYNPFNRTWTDVNGIQRSFDFNGNQYTGGIKSYGKAMSDKFINAGRIIGLFGVFISVNQCVNATTLNEQLEYGFDAFLGFSGVIAPEFFGLPSTIWFLGGKKITLWNARVTLIPMIEQGINPGLMEYQPFK